MLIELKLIREQMKSDFDFVMKAFIGQREVQRELVSALRAVEKAVEKSALQLEETEHTLEVHSQRTEQRFDQLIDLIGLQDERVSVLEGKLGTLPRLEARLEALERQQPPAS